MFRSRPLSDRAREFLSHLPPDVRSEIDHLSLNYESLRRVAGRDRDILLAVIARVGLRLDSLGDAFTASQQVVQAIDDLVADGSDA